jgi:hypothetical protein
MKKLFLLSFLLICSAVSAQFKAESDNRPDIRSGIVKNNSFGSLLGFINPDNFSMRHSFGLSYTAFGGYGGAALGVYTNSLSYKFNDQLKLETDISIVNSPYNSFGKDFSKQINGIYLNRAQLTFKPSDNMNIFIQYRNIPAGFSPYGFSGYSPFYRDSYFNEWGF